MSANPVVPACTLSLGPPVSTSIITHFGPCSAWVTTTVNGRLQRLAAARIDPRKSASAYRRSEMAIAPSA
jgi:hypothetical protein